MPRADTRESDGAHSHLLSRDAASEPLADAQTRLQNHFGSAGHLTGGAVTDGGGNTVDVSLGTGSFHIEDDVTSRVVLLPWDALAGLSVPSDTTRWIGVDYKLGIPQVAVATTEEAFESAQRFELAVVVNEGGTIHISAHTQSTINDARRTCKMLHDVFHVAHAFGHALGETGTRNVTVSPGLFYVGKTPFTTAAVDTSDADTFDAYHGSFTKQAGQTDWDNASPNTEYDNAGTLEEMTNNRWTSRWFYQETDGNLVMIYGQAQFTTQAMAEGDSLPTSIPDRLVEHGTFIGRMIVQKGAASAAQIQSAFVQIFTASGVTDHTQLFNIGETTHDQIDTHIGIAVTAAAVIADHAIMRGDGGARGSQGSGVKIDDDNNIVMLTGDKMAWSSTSGAYIIGTSGSLAFSVSNNQEVAIVANQMFFATGGDVGILDWGTASKMKFIINVTEAASFTAAGLATPLTFTSTLADGTKPFTVASTTLCDNLNADAVDGKHVGTSGNTIPLNDSLNEFSATQKMTVGNLWQFRQGTETIHSSVANTLNFDAAGSLVLTTPTIALAASTAVTIPTNTELQFRDPQIRLYSPSDGNAVLEADTLLTLGVGGDIIVGDGSGDVIHPLTNASMDLGKETHKFNDLWLAGDANLCGPLVHVGSTLGVFSATPVTQPAHIVDADGNLPDITTKFNTLLASLESLGVLADS